MPFDLPRNARNLRFTGEVRAAIDEAPRGALGQRRSRGPQSRGHVPDPPLSSRRDVYQADPVPTPFMAPQACDFDDDDAPTTMLDRDGLDVIAGGFGSHAPHPSERPRRMTAPVPNFRSPAEIPTVIVAPEAMALPLPVTSSAESASRPPPLAVWLVAAALLAVLSYKLAPAALYQADAMVKMLDAKASANQ